MEQEKSELVDMEHMMEMFNIPRGSINRLIDTKGFPKSMKATGTRFRYFLVSEVQKWVDLHGHFYRQKEKKKAKPVRNMAPTMTTIDPPTLPANPNATTHITYSYSPSLFKWNRENAG